MADAIYQHYGDTRKRKNGFGLGRAIRKAIKRFQTYRVNSRAIAELRGLDNRALDDIGITRGEIVYRVWNKDSFKG